MGGVCVCARKQWAYVFRCFSVSVQNIWRLPRSEVPGIVLLQGAVKILPRKIHLELRIPVFQRLHCNWHKIRRAAALCIWFEGAFWVPKWQLPGVFVICSKIAFFWKVNENYKISKIRRVAAFWTLFENDPKWQLPGGFLFFKNVHFWTILATVIKFQHFWYAQNVATLRVLVCCRHCCLHLQHRAWPRNTFFAVFCRIIACCLMLSLSHAGCNFATNTESFDQWVL